MHGYLRGKAALSKWVETGEIYDITDGVILLAHSVTSAPGEANPNERKRSAIPEALIESIS